MSDPRPVPDPRAALVAEPSLPTYAPDGTDLTLIRWMLALSPARRLDVLQDFVDGITELRNGRIVDPLHRDA